MTVLGSARGEDRIGTWSPAMCSDDAAGVEHVVGSLLLTGMSMFDCGQRPVEAIDQAFIVGLLLHLEKRTAYARIASPASAAPMSG